KGKNPSRNPLMTMSLLVLVPARKTSAERRASSTRTGLSPANTTHFTSSSGWSLARFRIVPPAPISMSSQWAPRQSRRLTRVRELISPRAHFHRIRLFLILIDDLGGACRALLRNGQEPLRAWTEKPCRRTGQ